MSVLKDLNFVIDVTPDQETYVNVLSEEVCKQSNILSNEHFHFFQLFFMCCMVIDKELRSIPLDFSDKCAFALYVAMAIFFPFKDTTKDFHRFILLSSFAQSDMEKKHINFTLFEAAQIFARGMKKMESVQELLKGFEEVMADVRENRTTGENQFKKLRRKNKDGKKRKK